MLYLWHQNCLCTGKPLIWKYLPIAFLSKTSLGHLDCSPSKSLNNWKLPTRMYHPSQNSSKDILPICPLVMCFGHSTNCSWYWSYLQCGVSWVALTDHGITVEATSMYVVSIFTHQLWPGTFYLIPSFRGNNNVVGTVSKLSLSFYG